MAITPKICYQYEADATDIILTDETGAYDVNLNTGGYGAPNNDRNTYAGVLRVYYQPYSGDKLSLLDLASSIRYSVSYTNTEESSWTVPYSKDGWYIFLYTLVPTSVGSPAEGTIIYDTNVDELRQYNSSLQLVEVYDESYLEDSTIYELALEEDMALVKLKNKQALIIKDYFNCAKCTDCNCSDEFMESLKIREAIGTTKNQFKVSKYESQKMTETLTKEYKI